ncbi:MAG: c-type cytochrome, partial [Chthoniobacteraceae bacterium]
MKLIICLTLVVVGSAISPGIAAEIPVRAGLVFHFDAAEQTAARPAASLSAPNSGAPLDRWVNTVAPTRTEQQPLAAARPIFRRDETEALVSFDGKDDFLPIAGARKLAPAVTVFVLAAPRGNAGQFSALFSTAEAGRNDYTSGLNLDLGPNATDQLSVLNLESAGAVGFRDWLEPAKNLAAELPFESFHVFTVRSRIGEKGNQLFLDGIRLGERTRLESNIGLDEMAIGARICSNDPAQAPFAQGFFRGDIAAVLVYDRALDDREREQVEQALFSRTPALNALAAGRSGHALEAITNPPPVQMLVPGFTVHEVPLNLTNLTSIRYRHDGKCVALGYDGRLHLLTDSNGDGIEDQEKIFWDQSPLRGPIGIALLGANDPRGDGVFVASKGKVSLILDRDRDGRGDEEIVVATGWKENFTNVDATGLALDPKDGSIYFCLGVEDFSNPYLIDRATGQSRFKLSTDRSSIQRVTPDFSKRETICTGVRFACALAFNRQGDLFASEQEGATWLPNGNPFDELLHIVPGRHYGFPPRHPRYLPEVIDEPAVMEYGPQHQSTVGMIFNEGVNGGPVFGPPSWAGDAIVCGESRGKLYRTRLVKTDQGYVGQNQIIACLGLLTVDACVTPQGDLLVACHSGPPDWGTGPAGEGKLFKIRYAKRDVPQPVIAWASAPDEIRVAFDRPLDPAEWAQAKDKIKIEAGRYVSAGDRFEVIRPGYQVVRDQLAAPRRWVDLQSLSLDADQRTLVLRVPRQVEPVNYAMTLPLPASWQTEGGIPQRPEMDLALLLDGLEAKLGGDPKSASIVLPHPSIPVSKAFTAGSVAHDTFFDQLGKQAAASSFTLRGQVDISNIFVPLTQPGSVLDWDPSADEFARRLMTVRQDFDSTRPAEVPLHSVPDTAFCSFDVAVPQGAAMTGSGFYYALDDRARPIALARLRVPWADSTPAATRPVDPEGRDDVKGNWLAGRRLFFGQATCGTCHQIGGEGIAFGPDLTNLIYRDRASALQDIQQPSATINPEQTGSTVTFTDGSAVAGIVATLTKDEIVVRLPGGIEMKKPRSQVVRIEPLKTSLMPEGLTQALSGEQMEDLLTFLLTRPIEPAPITRLDPPMPPARKRAEIAPFLETVGTPSASVKPLRILLVAGEKDHGVNEHDYPLWLDRWSRLLRLSAGVSVTTSMEFPTREQLTEADVTVFYSRNAGWNPAAAALLDEYQKRGGGLVYLHWSIEGGPDAELLA